MERQGFIIFLSIKLGMAVFLAFLTLVMTRRYNQTANKWLAAFLSGLCLIFLSDLIRQSETPLVGMDKIISVDLIIFLLPPALYMAVMSFIQPAKKISLREVLVY